LQRYIPHWSRIVPEVLSHERVVAEGASPEAWLYFVHGIYGAGRNWASVARRLTGARPDWGALLIDLRQHGASQDFSPPHTLAAAAADLRALADVTKKPPHALLGHSFGGKVALSYARNANPELRQLWIVDAAPEARPPWGSAWQVLGVLKAMPREFTDRSEAINALQANGVDAPVAQWLATNLELSGERYRWRFDLASMEALLLDFFATDLWEVLENPPAGIELHLIKAENSSVLSGETLSRVERLANDKRLWLHRVAGGHWVNADNPDALHGLLVTHLPRYGGSE
jgi:pimeloyl-ACP methyl ester carboxylesterase